MKKSQITQEGIFSYIHHNKKMGSLIHLVAYRDREAYKDYLRKKWSIALKAKKDL